MSPAQLAQLEYLEANPQHGQPVELHVDLKFINIGYVYRYDSGSNKAIGPIQTTKFVVLIAVSTTGLPYILSAYVVAGAMIMKNAEDNPMQRKTSPQNVQSLICLSEDGQLVRACQNAIGRFLRMCLAGTSVLGVDMIEGRWRVWKWLPIQGAEQLEAIQWLDTDVIRAYVIAEQAGDEREMNHFWAIEERVRNEIRITKRDTNSLAEIDKSLTLSGIRLVTKQTDNVRKLGEQNPTVMVAYNNALFLLGADQQDRVALYQVK
jgi:hypothetical protein